MGCLEVNIERVGGDLEAQLERVGGELAVSFSPICGTDAGLGLLASSDHHLLTDENDLFLSVTP